MHVSMASQWEVLLTFNFEVRRNVQDALRQLSSQKPSQTSLRLPRLLRLYLEIYQYPEEVISQNLDMAEDRDDFVETMSFNVFRRRLVVSFGRCTSGW